MHLKFHSLAVVARDAVADDAICLTLAVPPALAGEFRYTPGQHLPVRAVIDGREVRRTYSIVAGTLPGTVRLGIRVQSPRGLAHYLAHGIQPGETLEAMPPTGGFAHAPDPAAARRYLLLAAGSGITPVLSILSGVLAAEPASQVTLVYGNRSIASTMFLDELFALKNTYLTRFAVHFLMSREPQEVALLNGRLDGAKLRELANGLIDLSATDEIFVCGQGAMVQDLRATLSALGVSAPVHFERFSAPTAATASTAAPAASVEGSRMTIVQDGRRRTVSLSAGDESLLAAAGRAGIELPYSCRAGVCGTCRARVVEGSVRMEHNVALEDWELAAGYILTCQSHATSAEVVISYDDK